MNRLGVLLGLGLLTATGLAASGQSLGPQPPSAAAPPVADLPKSYIPGLGEFMERIQVDHAKLWLAGEARNWELAEYQLTELKEVFSDVQDLVPTYQNVPVGDMVDAIITGTIAGLESAVASRDFSTFSGAFDKLTAACNSCHQAANRAYIVIRKPQQSNFSNQEFAPQAK